MDFISPAGAMRRWFMDRKQSKAAQIAVIVLSPLTVGAARADAPQLHSNERVCRGAPVRAVDALTLLVNTQHAPAAKSCPAPALAGRAAALPRCWVGGFTDVEGQSGAADLR